MGTIIVGDFKSHKASRMPLHILQLWLTSVDLSVSFHWNWEEDSTTCLTRRTLHCFSASICCRLSSHPDIPENTPATARVGNSIPNFKLIRMILHDATRKKKTRVHLFHRYTFPWQHTWRSKLDHEWLWQPKSTVVASKSQSWWRIAAAEAKEKSPWQFFFSSDFSKGTKWNNISAQICPHSKILKPCLGWIWSNILHPAPLKHQFEDNIRIWNNFPNQHNRNPGCQAFSQQQHTSPSARDYIGRHRSWSSLRCHGTQKNTAWLATIVEKYVVM